ncbi:MAG: LysR family transcriptional regulator [Solirubrobacterales bacterium]|jgi:DNA-binding transcriptional LysR family regulator|nr:LysR family transcriptional regulator [Solirubrobacterales bacterium]
MDPGPCAASRRQSDGEPQIDLQVDFRQLYRFVAVAEAGQITRAAKALHLAQPALSLSIAKLEENLGLQLFERTARGVTLTVAGEAFYEKARVALTAAEEAHAALQPWLRGEATLILGLLPSVQPLVRPMLRRFMEARPDVDVQIRLLDPASRLRDLKRGEIDAELLFPPPPDDALVIETVAYAPRYVLLPESHPLASESELVFGQIAHETFPGRHPSVSEKWAAEAWLSDRRGHDPPVTREAPVTLDDLWTLIHAGKAIAVLPEFMVRQIASDGVRAVPLIDVEPLELGMARRKDDTRPVLAAFFEVVREFAQLARREP